MRFTAVIVALFAAVAIAVPVAEPVAEPKADPKTHVYLDVGDIVDPAACCL
jgi:hypothetical protein